MKILYDNIREYFDKGRYSSGRRGGPAKAVGRATGARVQIPLFPPERNCTHPWNKNLGCVFFFLQDSFGLVMPYNKPDIEPSENWKNLNRDDLGRFLKNEK